MDEEVSAFVVVVGEVAGDEVSTASEFEVTPEGFDGIEIRGVRREPFELRVTQLNRLGQN